MDVLGFIGLNKIYTCEVNLTPRNHIKIQIFCGGKQIGGSIHCLRYGLLENTLCALKLKYDLKDEHININIKGVRLCPAIQNHPVG